MALRVRIRSVWRRRTEGSERSPREVIVTEGLGGRVGFTARGLRDWGGGLDVLLRYFGFRNTIDLI